MSIRRLDNRSGIIMLIVISFILVMSIMLAGIFSRSISVWLTGTNKAKSARAEMLARGVFWQTYDQLNTDNTLPASSSVTLDGILYTFTITKDGAGLVTVQVTYPD